jgi:hypothetical protein
MALCTAFRLWQARPQSSDAPLSTALLAGEGTARWRLRLFEPLDQANSPLAQALAVSQLPFSAYLFFSKFLFCHYSMAILTFHLSILFTHIVFLTTLYHNLNLSHFTRNTRSIFIS